MDYMEFARMISNEKLSIEYLRKKYKGRLRCKHCGSEKFYHLKNGNRVRCAECKKDLRVFSHTMFGRVRITYSKWLAIIKLFQLSVSANEAAYQMGLNYKTVMKAYDTLRLAIIREPRPTRR